MAKQSRFDAALARLDAEIERFNGIIAYFEHGTLEDAAAALVDLNRARDYLTDGETPAAEKPKRTRKKKGLPPQSRSPVGLPPPHGGPSEPASHSGRTDRT